MKSSKMESHRKNNMRDRQVPFLGGVNELYISFLHVIILILLGLAHFYIQGGFRHRQILFIRFRTFLFSYILISLTELYFKKNKVERLLVE